MKLNRKVLRQMVETGQLAIGASRNSASSGVGGSSTINSNMPQSKSPERKDDNTDLIKMIQNHEARIAQLEKEIESLKAALNKTK